MRYLSAAVVIAAILAASPLAHATTLRVKLMWVKNDQYAGELLALHDGLYSARGLDVRLLQYEQGGPDPYHSVLSGSADVGISEVFALLRSAIKDDAKIVVFGLKDQISPAGFMSLAEAGIKAPKDFEGRTFGYYNDTDLELLSWYAAKNDVDVKRIATKKLRPNDMRPLNEGRVHFIIAHETNEPVMMKLQGHDTNFISLSGPRGIHFGPAFFCREDFYDAHRKELEAFIQATSEGWRRAIADPGRAADIVLAQYPKEDYIDGSGATTLAKFNKSLGIKQYYMTYKVGPDCICCMSKIYWGLVRSRLYEEGLIAEDDDVDDYVRFDAVRGIIARR